MNILVITLTMNNGVTLRAKHITHAEETIAAGGVEKVTVCYMSGTELIGEPITLRVNGCGSATVEKAINLLKSPPPLAPRKKETRVSGGELW